jgi:hypothetical protein
MISNKARGINVRTRTMPFLVRFTQERLLKDATNRNELQTPDTIVTEVRRETTDDR